jgi:hypothetical protein
MLTGKIPGLLKMFVACRVLAAPMMLATPIMLAVLMVLSTPMVSRAQDAGQTLGTLPSVQFKGRMVKLSKPAMQLLSDVADNVRRNPTSKLLVRGYGESSKGGQQLSWDRVNAVITYLVEKQGISEDRFIFRYGQPGGDTQVVDLLDGTNQEGPHTVPAPHPNLRTIQRR